jgi:hypothetical protein
MIRASEGLGDEFVDALGELKVPEGEVVAHYRHGDTGVDVGEGG